MAGEHSRPHGGRPAAAGELAQGSGLNCLPGAAGRAARRLKRRGAGIGQGDGRDAVGCAAGGLAVTQDGQNHRIHSFGTPFRGQPPLSGHLDRPTDPCGRSSGELSDIRFPASEDGLGKSVPIRANWSEIAKARRVDRRAVDTYRDRIAGKWSSMVMSSSSTTWSRIPTAPGGSTSSRTTNLQCPSWPTWRSTGRTPHTKNRPYPHHQYVINVAVRDDIRSQPMRHHTHVACLSIHVHGTH